jgi:hypothetical protein
MTTDAPGHDDRDGEEPIEEIAETAKAENPDPTTARESFELELMEEGRSEEGSSIELDDDADEADPRSA